MRESLPFHPASYPLRAPRAEAEAKVCVCVSAPASVCDPQRLYNPVLLMLSRVLLSITESSNQSGGLEQLTEAGLSSQTGIPLSSCSVSDSVCVHVHLCVCSLGITGTFSVSRYS